MTLVDRGLTAPSESGAIGPRSWLAKMIAPLCDEGQGTRASFVANDFLYQPGNGPAELHISAQGLYRAFINGVRVGDDQLTPGWMCFDDRIAYQTYDVSSLLNEGENTITIWLGDGWFRSQMMWRETQVVNCWGDRIAAIAELEVAGAMIAGTDETWGSGFLPITRTGIYHGEDYDARLENLNVTSGVEALAFDTKKLVSQETGSVQELAPLVAVESWQDGDATVYDFGQNAGGYVRFTAQGDAGASVRIEHSEVLGPNRHFDNRNYRDARSESRYILKGGAPETHAPFFTFMGYRYARHFHRGQRGRVECGFGSRFVCA